MSGYPLMDIFLSTLYFFAWVLWFMLMFFPWNGLVVVVMARLRPKARRILK